MRARSTLSVAALLLACSSATPPAADPAPAPPLKPGVMTQGDKAPPWPSFAHRFVEDYFKAHPAFAVVQGRHEFDGKLPDWSRAGLEAEVARLERWRERAEAYDPAGLGETDRVERAVILHRIDRDVFWMKTARWPYRNPFFYFDWMLDNLDPNVYVTREYAPLAERAAAFVKYAKAVPTATAQIRENLESPMPRSWIDFGAAGFSGLAAYYEGDVQKAFASLDDEGLKSSVAEAAKEAATAMRDLSTWLESLRATATEDYALGPELFVQMVRQTEGLDVTLERLVEVGQADLERNLAALKTACDAYAPRKTIDKCIARVQRSKPKGGAVEGARVQLVELEAFLRKEGLVSIPGTEVAKVEEAPPYMRQNFAYIDIPGPYEKGLPSTYYISPPDPKWSKKVRDSYVPGEADLMFTSVHEVWPGHFTQFLHANRVESEVNRVFLGYANTEGWAHYSEEMMCAEGLCADRPDIQIGQLLNALLRNVRYLSAIGLHAQGMSMEESERLFQTKGHQDAGNSKQQAARGTYDAAYLNYTLGKLMIRKLWADAKAKDPALKLSTFHDRFLGFGGPPVPVVREAILGPDAGDAL